ncbi:MAG: tetratricopeptide repeat protein [Bacteroidetes bacterium]|nr:MAG: tetratricopeptide repeat protein [Bacteroidota bacterium]
MRQNLTSTRKEIFDTISKYEEMLDKGRVCFPNEGPYHQLIDYFEKECLLDRAIEVAEHALAQFGFTADFHIRKASTLLKMDLADQALMALDKAGALAPGFLKIDLMRAEGLAALGMKEQALDLLDRLKETADAQVLSEILVCEALIYEQEHAYEHMFYLLKAALEANPMNDEALSRMMLCVEHAGKHEESVELHKRIIDEDPFSHLAWYNLGAAYHYLCEYDKAIEAYEYAFLTNEFFEFAYRDCAEVCLYVKNYQKALQCYQEVIKRFDPDADLLVHIAECHYYLGNYKVAKSFYMQAAQLDPFNPDAVYGVGCCYAMQNNWRAAADFSRRAILVDDQNELYFEALADACYHLGKYKEAELYYRQATEIAPEEARYWMKLAQFLVSQGRSRESLEVLEEAEEYSGSSELLYCRSACLFMMGKKKQAMLALEDALFEDFESHGHLFQWLPILQNDSEVKAIIATLKPDIPDNIEQLNE